MFPTQVYSVQGNLSPATKWHGPLSASNKPSTGSHKEYVCQKSFKIRPAVSQNTFKGFGFKSLFWKMLVADHMKMMTVKFQ